MRIHILYTLLLLGLGLSSCHVTRQVETSKINVDSLVTHVKDSMDQIKVAEVSELKRMISEITASGVTFVVDSCPEREAVFSLLDSAGRANYEKALLQDKIKSLTNKVFISEKGAITAEGRIQAAYFSNSKLQEELFRNELTIDRLTKENDSLTTQLNKSSQGKNKQVEKKSGFPWLVLWLAISGGFVVGWVARSRLSIVKNQSMNKLTIFLLPALMLLASCGSAGKEPNDNITFGQAWKYAWTLPAYYVWVIIAIVGGLIAGYFLKRDSEKKGAWSAGHSIILFVLTGLFLAALLAAPAGIAANTTVEQALRGVYIR